MRVLFLNPSSQLGGAERSLLDVIASLRSRCPDWDLQLIVSDDGPLVERARRAGATVTVLEFPPLLARLGDAAVRGPAGDRIGRATLVTRLLLSIPATIRYVVGLRRRVARLEPDVVHTNGFKMHVLGLWAAGSRYPVVWHIHDYVSVRPVMSRLLRRLVDRCAGIIANSESVKADLSRTLGTLDKVRRVYNGVDVEVFSPEGPTLDLDVLCKLPPAGPEIVKVGLVATLGRWKGHAVFLRALAELDPSLPVRGYIVGGALYQTGGSQYALEDLMTMGEALELGDRIGFSGFVENPEEAIRALDVVVHASTQPEPFGLVIIEAMSCGRALVASEAGGSVELFESGVNALGYEPGDVEGLAERIRELARDPELRRRLGEAGRATVMERFDRRLLAEQIAPIYEAAVAGRP